MPTRRQEKVADRIHEVVSNLLLLEIRDPRLADVTVMHVQVSPDLRLARVLISALGDEEARQNALAGLQHASSYIRREVAQRLKLRFAPDIVFSLDDSWTSGARIDELLEQLKKDEER